MKSQFFLESSLAPLGSVPFVAAYGRDDDHLRIPVLLATYLGQPEDSDVKACTAPSTPWAKRLDAFEELLLRAQGKRSSRPFAGLIHPDAFPIAFTGEEGNEPEPERGGEDFRDDPSFLEERRDLARVLMRSFERGGWLLLRPAPRSETTDLLLAVGCVAETSGPFEFDEDHLARTMLGLDLSPAMQSLVWGLVRAGRLRASAAARRIEAASPGMVEAVVFETAYDALSVVAVEAAERLSVLRGPQKLNGVAGPFVLREGDLDDLHLPRAAVDELIARGWLGLGRDRDDRCCFAVAEPIRGLLYERAVMMDEAAVKARHRWLAGRGGPSAAEQVEAHYHAIESGDDQLAMATATYYGADLRRLARALSEDAARGDVEKFLRAADIYRAIVDRFDSTDAYAWEYRGYNLARYYFRKKLPPPPSVEAEIRTCYANACARDEANPLYRGREIGFRARLGDDIGSEFRRWMAHFMQLSSRRGIRFASPVLEALPTPDARKALAGPWLPVLKRERDKKLAGLLS
ncbi:MAG TPA: hypothetical protein VLS89_17550 [Candidatus Nanopelagicales bacterium]|nr:hypothetical protein [Candidatus Nanopelagicales bacterium]